MIFSRVSSQEKGSPHVQRLGTVSRNISRVEDGERILALLQSAIINPSLSQTLHVWLPSLCAFGAKVESLDTLELLKSHLLCSLKMRIRNWLAVFGVKILYISQHEG